jgi:two-component system chemotaxis response regulator CheB
LQALKLGATDYIPKPPTTRDVTILVTFGRELIERIRQLGLRARRRHAPARSIAPRHPVPEHVPSVVTLRPMPVVPPRVLLIDFSTGGPLALDTILSHIGSALERALVLITQHMPPIFIAIHAEHLTRAAGCPILEAVNSKAINASSVYIAPGGKHMRIARSDDIVVVVIDGGPPVNFCKPAVDLLFISAATVWGPPCTGVGGDRHGP